MAAEILRRVADNNNNNNNNNNGNNKETKLRKRSRAARVQRSFISKKACHRVIPFVQLCLHLKIYASSENNLERVMRTVKGGMDCIGLRWNEKKCAVVHVKRGCVKQTENMEIDELKSIESLGEESTYKCLGVLENSKQEDKLVLENAWKECLRRLAIIWSSPLSDHSRVAATNQYALPLLSYLMWTQTWPLAQLQQVDREARKIIVEFGGKHPQGSTAILYMSRKCGGRGLRSVETIYKEIKIKAAMKPYYNPDPSYGGSEIV